MIFAKKKSKDGKFVLLRFCNKLNTNVVGGASKLFKYFIKNYNFTEITTCVNRSHDIGKLYETLGFNFVSKSRPNYYYIIRDIRYHRYNFRKNIFIKDYDKDKSLQEIILERKINRIYDSGNLKYVFV